MSGFGQRPKLHVTGERIQQQQPERTPVPDMEAIRRQSIQTTQAILAGLRNWADGWNGKLPPDWTYAEETRAWNDYKAKTACDWQRHYWRAMLTQAITGQS
jgi:hypothetical protein